MFATKQKAGFTAHSTVHMADKHGCVLTTDVQGPTDSFPNPDQSSFPGIFFLTKPVPKSIQIQKFKFPLLWKHCHVKQEKVKGKYHSDSSLVPCRLLALHPLVSTHAHTSRDKPADAGPPGSRFA